MAEHIAECCVRQRNVLDEVSKAVGRFPNKAPHLLHIRFVRVLGLKVGEVFFEFTSDTSKAASKLCESFPDLL